MSRLGERVETLSSRFGELVYGWRLWFGELV
jgi:hypothetical protein